MSKLTAAGAACVSDIARRYGLSEPAVEHMARAVSNGGGSMAQFNVPELGGSGQWMAGGMTMVGDMFNHGLQNTVSSLCSELANAMGLTQFFETVQDISGGSWWPDGLGLPASTGGQNQARYAYFPQSRRIAYDHGDGRPLTILDTGDHNIGGFSQQQSGGGDPYFGVSVSSQFGQFALSSFPLADTSPSPAPVQDPIPESQESPDPAAPEYAAPAAQRDMAPVANDPVANDMATTAHPDQTAEILSTIEGLARLRDAGALSEDEFSYKKAELLARL